MALFIMAAATFTTTVHVAVAQDEHDQHGVTECDTPTQTIDISTVDGTDLKFDKTELKATKGACVMIRFFNVKAFEHDFTLEKEDGTQWTHLHLDNSLDNETGPAQGMRMVHLQMPDEDKTFEFYCSVNGHKAAGMKGNFVVGEGSPSEDDSPAFGLITAFAGLIALMAIAPILRRKN